MNCGGESAPGASFCQYCGAAVTISGRPSQSHARLFEQIKASPQFHQAQSPERLAKLPQPSGAPKTVFTLLSALVAGKAAMAVVGFLLMPILFLGMLFMMSPVFQNGMPNDPQLLSASFEGAQRNMFRFMIFVVPCIIFLFVVTSIGFGLVARHFSGHVYSSVFQNIEALEKSPVEVRPAIAVAKRTQVWGGIGNHAASTRYFVTFETEDGRRQEYALWYGAMYGGIAEDDAGVLFTRGDYAADFDRIAITV
ncbi:DUF2500 family protein [Blastopirellula sp. J2-11]|uniref:DUF2500 family protein n=1 Tax=Blastopirellula sp. J2-11 TaxID=2943192 RepID=UPI0021C93B63|nr:DUF2500 family protein [Blastopirellula sp. J2-11]UUO09206.1 DUF2500 family protein [Blastopirellula sp. J2-11]